MTESFTEAEREAMDAHAAEMMAMGHNGNSDYYNGGWVCYRYCRECDTPCPECGAASWEPCECFQGGQKF